MIKPLMNWRCRAVASIVCVLLQAWPGAGSVRAAEAHSFCTAIDSAQVCFPSREQAEAVIRQGAYVRSQLELMGTAISEADFEQTTLVYRARDSVPESLGSPTYTHGIGMTPQNAQYSCSNGACASEGEAVSRLTAYLEANKPPNCTLEIGGITGSYAEPFDTIISFAGVGSRAGGFSFGNAGNPRALNFAYRCGGNATPTSNTLLKAQGFVCPVDYLAYSHQPPDFGLTRKQAIEAQASGVLCYSASNNYATITTKTTQVASCRANDQPCHPATGDKSRQETDFEFGGRPFTRHYHSLRQVAMLPAFAPGWTHSLSDRLEILGPVGATLVREEGQIEMFRRTSSPNIHEYASDLTRNSVLLFEPGVGSRLSNANGSIKHFDADGRLIAHEQPDAGIRIVLGYEAGRLDTATDPQGRVLQFRYVGGLLDRVELPDGGVVRYRRDAHGNLDQVTHPDAASRTYVYNELAYSTAGHLHELTGIIDERGQRHATFGYDSRGRVTLSRLTGGEQTTLDYVSDTQVNVVRPTGETVTYHVAPGQKYRRLASVVGAGIASTLSYSGGQLGQVVRGGVTTQYGYAPTYRRLVVEAYGTPQERHTTVLRDADYGLAGRELFAKVGSAMVSTRRQAWTRNSRGQPLSATVVDSATGASRTRTTTYCEQPQVDAGSCPVVGLVTSIDGPRTDLDDATVYTYYGSDHPGCANGAATCTFRKGDLRLATNPLGQSTEYLAYDGAGRAAQVKDFNGVRTDLEYHPRGWLLSRKVRGSDDQSEVDDAITRVAYNAIGQVTRVTHPDGSFVAMTYDAAQRLTRMEDALGNSVTYTLDGAGHRTAESVRDASGSIKRSLSRAYDTVGRLQLVRNAAGATVSSLAYDARDNLDTNTDGLGRTTDRDFDPLDRISRVIEDVGGINATTQFTLNAADELTAVVDPKGLLTQYTYNGLGDLLGLTSPDTGSTTYGYDSGGNRVLRTDARGRSAIYAHDAIGRLGSMALPTAAQNVTFDHDVAPADCVAGERASIGRLARIRDESGSTRYCYNHLGQPVRKVQGVTGGPTLTLGSTYNGAGRVAAMTYPSGAIVAYLRNGNGQVTGVSAHPTSGSPQVTLASNVTYLPFGPLQQLTFGNGRVLTKAHDSNYAIDKVSDNAPGGLSEDSTVDIAGNITQIAERTNATATATRKLAYDNLNRLTSLKNNATNIQSFAYDPTGNRLQKTLGTAVTVNTYPATSHRLFQEGGTKRSYDANGNTITIGAKAFAYDDRNRLRDIKANGTSVTRTYRYNGKGERVSKVQAPNHANNRFYFHDDAGHLLGEYKADGTRVQEYVWLDDQLIAVLGDHDASTYQFVETDHLGTPRAIVHPAENNIVWRWNITDTAFGEHAAVQNPDGDAATYVFNLRYPGQHFDAESGLNYNYFRDYEPGTGRYIESDPIGLEGGPSTYAYVGGSPFGYSDPFGLDKIVTDMACGCTRYYDDDGALLAGWASRTEVSKRALPGADGPYSSTHVYATPGPYKNNPAAFGPNWILKTDDPRGRWIHGGGTGLANPSAPYQGWKPTMGCTRMQNADVQALVDLVRARQAADPNRKISYERITGIPSPDAP